MANCFTYTYKTLRKLGYDLPSTWGKYSTSNMKEIENDSKLITEAKMHYDYFESFCSYVKDIQPDDIVINDNGVGLAVNKYKFVTVCEKRTCRALMNITKDCKALRIDNG